MKTQTLFALVLSHALAGGVGSWASDQHPVDPALQFETLVTGLVEPTSMAFIGNGDLLILQKTDGRVLRVTNGQLAGTVLDVAVESNAEQGLLGIAVDPAFLANGYVYLLYTESATGADTSVQADQLGTRIYRYRWNGSALVEPRLLVQLPMTPGSHVGGVMAFGPDDKLYVITGDMEATPPGQLQNIPSGPPPNDRGVIFRLNTDGSAPSDNPFYDAASPGNPMNRYYAYGIRNSFGFGFDPVTGVLWESENGPSFYDEINRVVPGMNGGHNPIWGPDARDPEGVGDLWMAPGATYVDPLVSWLVPPALTSVAFVDSPKLGCAYEHDLLVGAYNCRVIYRFDLDEDRESLVLPGPTLADGVVDNSSSWCDEEQSEILFAVGPPWDSDSTTDIENGPDGLVYVLSYSHGTLRRFVPVPGMVPDGDADQVANACDCAPADPSAWSVPLEVPRLRLVAGTPLSIVWDSQRGRAGTGTRYSVVTGTLAALRGEQGFDSACTLASNLADPRIDDGRSVPAGSGLYYLVRAANACGAATFGEGSGSPDARDALDASLPPDCP